MIALLSMRRLVVGLVVVVLCGGIVGSGYAREPVLIHIDKYTGTGLAFDFVAFTPNSEAIVLSCNGELSLWKTRAEPGAIRVIKRMKAKGSADYVRGVAPIAVSSDGNYVAVSAGGRGSNIAWSNSLQVWDITKSSVVATYAAKEHYQSHSYFTFVPKSTDMYIAVERSLEIWSPATGKRRVIASADTYEGQGVQHMRVLKDGSLVTSRADGRICLWDTKKGALKAFRNVRCSIYRVPGGGSIRTHYVVTSPDGKQAAAIDYVKTPVLIGDTLHEYPTAGYKLTLWDIEKGKPIRGLPLGAGKRDASSIAWSHDGRFLAWVSGDVADDDGRTVECVIWDVIKEKEVMREKPPTGIAIGGVISFSPDGKLLAMPAGDKSQKAMVALWDISDLTKPDDDGDDKDEDSQAESKRKVQAK